MQGIIDKANAFHISIIRIIIIINSGINNIHCYLYDRTNGWLLSEVQPIFDELHKEGLINCIHEDHYTRIHYADKEIRV